MNNSFKIANAIGLIDDELIMDAEEFKTSSQKPVYIRYAAAAAACLCVAGGAAVIAGERKAPVHTISSELTNTENHGIQSSNTGSDPVTSYENHGIQSSNIGGDPVTSNMPVVKMSEVYFNETSSPEVGGSRLYFDPEKYDTIVWNEQDITEYFGKELTVKYIPEGLAPSGGNGTASVIAEKGGGIVLDHVWLSYYHDFYEDGSPKLTENVAATKGFDLIASKLGYPFQCGILVPSEDMKVTDINGTEVLFGHRSMPYGPYDPETHEPSGYYDIYTAGFEFDGISYSVTSDQLEAAETVKIVSSIIYGEDVFVGEE